MDLRMRGLLSESCVDDVIPSERSIYQRFANGTPHHHLSSFETRSLLAEGPSGCSTPRISCLTHAPIGWGHPRITSHTPWSEDSLASMGLKLATCSVKWTKLGVNHISSASLQQHRPCEQNKQPA
jgi:hypothetical protein